MITSYLVPAFCVSPAANGDTPKTGVVDRDKMKVAEQGYWCYNCIGFKRKGDSMEKDFLTKFDSIGTAGKIYSARLCETKSFLDEWTTVSKIGTGSCGEVYKIGKRLGGFDAVQYSAVKVCDLADSRTDVNDWLREIRTQQKLKGHPNAVQIEDYAIVSDEDGYNSFLLIRMELLDKLPETGLSERQTIEMGIDICNVLDACCNPEINMIHRDIKPDNILVDSNGRYKLGDFGTAKILERTQTTVGSGTVAFMSPEAFNSSPDSLGDIRSDIFSLGMTMAAMLNGGRVVSEKSTDFDTTAKNFQRLGISHALAQVLAKMTAYSINERYQHPLEAKRDLEALIKEQREAEEKQKIEQAQKHNKIKSEQDESRRRAYEAEENAKRELNLVVCAMNAADEDADIKALRDDMRTAEKAVKDSRRVRLLVDGGKSYDAAVQLVSESSDRKTPTEATGRTSDRIRRYKLRNTDSFRADLAINDAECAYNKARLNKTTFPEEVKKAELDLKFARQVKTLVDTGESFDNACRAVKKTDSSFAGVDLKRYGVSRFSLNKKWLIPVAAAVIVIAGAVVMLWPKTSGSAVVAETTNRLVDGISKSETSEWGLEYTDEAFFSISKVNGEGIISSISANAPENLVVPPIINGIKVSGISTYAMEQVYACSNVYLPKTLKTFYAATTPVDAFLPDNLVSISVSRENPYFCSENGVLYNKDKSELLRCPPAFSGAYAVPESVQTIGEYAFSACSKLESIEYLGQIKLIRDYAFEQCTAFREIPSTVKELGYGAFCSTYMTSVSIPSGVGIIDSNTFSNASLLRTVTFNNSPEEIPDGMFFQCTNLELVDIPDSVKHIGEQSFQDCVNLKTLIVPESVITIDSQAFIGCVALTVYAPHPASWYGDVITQFEPPQVYGYDFSEETCQIEWIVTDDTTISEWGIEYTDDSVFVCDTVNEQYVITSFTDTVPDTLVIPPKIDGKVIEGIDDEAMKRVYMLKEVYIPVGVKSIPVGVIPEWGYQQQLQAFYVAEDNQYYSTLDGILYTKNYDTLLKCPCRKVGDVNIHNNAVTIASSAFESCDMLTSVAIPDTVTRIEDSAFIGCHVKINIPSNLKYLGEYGLAFCSAERCFIPSDISYIGQEALSYCRKLETVTIEEGVESIPDRMLYGCVNLKELHIPSTVKSIGEDALYGCVDLTVYAPYPPEHYKGLQLAFDSYDDENSAIVDKDYTINWVTTE